MAFVTPFGSIEVAVSSKIAIFTLGSGTKVYYRTKEFGTTAPQWIYQQDITANSETVLTPGSSYDKVRIDAGPIHEVEYVTGSAPTCTLLESSATTSAELDVLDGTVSSVTFTPAAGGANVSEVTIAFFDAAGSAITSNLVFEWWLSDAATGLGITGTAASGTVAVKSGEGSDLSVLTAKKHTVSQTKASLGTYVLEITDTSKTGFYVCVKHPVTGVIQVSDALVTADYGS